MNPPVALVDVQSHADTRQLPISRVGIRGLKHPMTVLTEAGDAQPVLATADLYVHLTADQKGTHMSRFIEALQAQTQPLNFNVVNALLCDLKQRLQTDQSHLKLRFPFVMRKHAPVSGVESYLDYEIGFLGDYSGNTPQVQLQVVVPVTSLCPCSKAISDYGAHNQRSHITVTATLRAPLAIEQLIRAVEAQASCELYGILKRADEKYVTERAYDNPKFVEDLVRDIAMVLKQEPAIAGFTVESENFESIHNHSAYACLEVE